MKILHYFRHMDSSDALKYDIEHKLAGLETLINSSMPVHVSYTIHNPTQNMIHIGLHARCGTLMEVEEESEDMHKTVELVVDTLKRNLSREKAKASAHHPERIDRFAQQASAAAAVAPTDDEEVFDGEFEPATPTAQQQASFT